MTNAIATTQDFQQRMFERIRDQMGDLLTDDDLKKIVAAAIEKAFFEKVARSTSYGTNYDDPPFLKMIRELLDKQFTAACRTWVKDNESLLREQVEKHAATLLPAVMTGIVRGIVDANTFSLVNELRQKGLIA